MSVTRGKKCGMEPAQLVINKMMELSMRRKIQKMDNVTEQNPFSCHFQIILIRGFNYPAHSMFFSLPILCRCAGSTVYL